MSSIVTHLKRQEVQPQLRQESATHAPCWLAHRTMNREAKTCGERCILSRPSKKQTKD